MKTMEELERLDDVFRRKRRSLLLCLVSALLFFSTTTCAHSAESKTNRNVQIGLHASWPETPLSLEAATYLRDVSV